MNLNNAQLKAFAAVADSHSFERAASTLHITQSAVSQRVKLLEDSLGKLLIIRGQPLSLTSAGERLLSFYKQQQLLECELLDAIGEKKGSDFTTLALALNADSLTAWFFDALQQLMENTNLLLDLRVCDQNLTHHYLRKGEVLGCISSVANTMQGCRTVALGAMTYRAVASPVYFQRYFKQGVDAQTIKQVPAVDFDQLDQLQNEYLLNEFAIVNSNYPKHRVPSVDAYMSLINRGLAWGMLPDMLIESLLINGELIELSPDVVVTVPLYWHCSLIKSPTLKRIELAVTKYCQVTLSSL
ncbi:LysR family transcriptional regulator ArgP [Paraglaciecola sp.]|uniref:LysR family transcriptional regulator ArgP n=1 Tax=Paraglaciecola sp. TaxID=1920173 RepID=UPI0030F405C2